jgi:hypothetical protein
MVLLGEVNASASIRRNINLVMRKLKDAGDVLGHFSIIFN